MVVLNRNGSFALLFLFLSKHDDLTASTAVRLLFVSVCEGINFISVSRE